MEYTQTDKEEQHMYLSSVNRNKFFHFKSPSKTLYKYYIKNEPKKKSRISTTFLTFHQSLSFLLFTIVNSLKSCVSDTASAAT